MRSKPQIAVIGSSGKITAHERDIARSLGRELAKHQIIVLFSHEGDVESLPAIVAREFRNHGGEVIAFLWNGAKTKPESTIIIDTGADRGGGREFLLIRSADLIIAIAGGSGTLMEIAMAYQLGKPVVALTLLGGWSKRLAQTFLDKRKREVIHGVSSPKTAVEKAIELIKHKAL